MKNNNFELRNVFHMFKMEFKLKRKGLLFWVIGLLGLTALYMGLFKTVASMLGEEFSKLPPELLSIVGGNLDLANYNQYFGMVFKIVSLVISAYVFVVITSSIHDEIHKGTGEYLYSQRVTRSEVIVSKIFIALFLYIVLNLTVMITALIIGASISEPTFDALIVFKIVWITSLPSLAFVGIGVLISSLLKKNVKALGVTLAVFFGLFLLGYISTLAGDKLIFFKWFSFVGYISYKDVINNTNSVWIGLIISLSIAFATMISGTLLYKHKDL